MEDLNRIQAGHKGWKLKCTFIFQALSMMLSYQSNFILPLIYPFEFLLYLISDEPQAISRPRAWSTPLLLSTYTKSLPYLFNY